MRSIFICQCLDLYLFTRFGSHYGFSSSYSHSPFILQRCISMNKGGYCVSLTNNKKSVELKPRKCKKQRAFESKKSQVSMYWSCFCTTHPKTSVFSRVNQRNISFCLLSLLSDQKMPSMQLPTKKRWLGQDENQFLMAEICQYLSFISLIHWMDWVLLN
jgi:hypothetical protein